MILDPAKQPDGRWLILAHGAGGSMKSDHLVKISAGLVERGIGVVRFDFPYRQAGKSIPDPMPKLMAAYREAIDFAKAQAVPRVLMIGGHSMGGRVASMLASEGPVADRLVLFSYPWAPPGKPEKLRFDHLTQIAIPTLCFSGTDDPFVPRDVLDARLTELPKTFELRWIEGADHSLHVKKSSGRTDSEVRSWLCDEVEVWSR